jgi:hypothetical protein
MTCSLDDSPTIITDDAPAGIIYQAVLMYLLLLLLLLLQGTL